MEGTSQVAESLKRPVSLDSMVALSLTAPNSLQHRPCLGFQEPTYFPNLPWEPTAVSYVLIHPPVPSIVPRVLEP